MIWRRRRHGLGWFGSSAARPGGGSALVGASRRGITLLEVLVAIFVLTVGLLGVAALLPIGKYEMEQGARSDRAASLGQAAFRDLQVRGLLSPLRWSQVGGGPVLEPSNAGRTLGQGFTPPLLPPFVLDPLAATYPANAVIPGWFPTSPLAGDAANLPMYRFTLPEFSVPGALPPAARELRHAAARRLFSSSDELVFDVPRMAELRPTLQPRWSPGADGRWGVANTDDDNNGTTDDASEAGWPGSDDLAMRTTSGDFTYLVTVAPSISEMFDNVLYQTEGHAISAKQYTVSVVVFYRRDLLTPPNTPPQPNRDSPAPPERMVWCDFPDYDPYAVSVNPDLTRVSVGGGMVRLRTSGGPRWLDVKPGQWILLTAYVPDPAFDNPPGSGSGNGRQRLASWYRIVSVGVGNTDQPNSPWYYRDVTLAGPDWYPDRHLDADAAAGGFIYSSAFAAPHNWPAYDPPTAYATLLDGAIAVYEKTIYLSGY
jgi:hypothetical protein